MLRFKLRELAAGVALTAAVSSVALAQMSSIIDKRVASMKSQGAAMATISKYVKGEAEFSPAVEEAAKRLQEHSKAIPSEFPEGSTHEKSRAKPEIWTNWPAFEKWAKDLQAASDALADAVASKDKGRIGAALSAAGKTCGGCHDAFRSPPKA